MTEFIDRQEARYLDLLYLGIVGVLSYDTPQESYDDITTNNDDYKRMEWSK